jgi:hypothetical protein
MWPMTGTEQVSISSHLLGTDFSLGLNLEEL